MSESAGYKAPRWAWWVATGFGSGYLKPAPGTWGSLVSIPVWIALAWGGVWEYLRFAGSGNVVHALLILLYLSLLPIGMTILAIRVSELVVRETGSKDPSFIVADEWAGQWIALTPLLFNAVESTSVLRTLVRLAVPFLLFRLFDIWKPWPARQLQEIPGGLGVVLDDVAAGIYAAILTFFLNPLVVSHIG